MTNVIPSAGRRAAVAKPESGNRLAPKFPHLAPVLRMVTPSRNAAVIQVLRDWLAVAEQGGITGMACVALINQPGHWDHVTEVVGSCFDNPLLARGMIRSLDDELGHMVSQRNCSL